MPWKKQPVDCVWKEQNSPHESLILNWKKRKKEKGKKEVKANGGSLSNNFSGLALNHSLTPQRKLPFKRHSCQGDIPTNHWEDWSHPDDGWRGLWGWEEEGEQVMRGNRVGNIIMSRTGDVVQWQQNNRSSWIVPLLISCGSAFWSFHILPQHCIRRNEYWFVGEHFLLSFEKRLKEKRWKNVGGI